jgi:hypothetical protein
MRCTQQENRPVTWTVFLIAKTAGCRTLFAASSRLIGANYGRGMEAQRFSEGEVQKKTLAANKGKRLFALNSHIAKGFPWVFPNHRLKCADGISAPTDILLISVSARGLSKITRMVI